MISKTTSIVVLCFLPWSLLAYKIIPFWQEDFSFNQIPLGWQSADENISNPVIWQHCENFNHCPPLSFFGLGVFPDFRFNSATMENGFAYIAPLTNGGSHKSSLTTTAIDCSNRQQVFLSFSTFIVGENSNMETNARVEVRQGASGDWVPFTVFPNLNAQAVEPNPLSLAFGSAQWITSFNGQRAIIDLSPVAAGQDEVYIRWQWQWSGEDEYFWLIDDVSLLDENPLYENAIWGANPFEGDFTGGLNDWTVPLNFNCLWEWTPNGLLDTEDSGDLADLYNCSCTAADGAMAINALCNAPDPTPSLSELVSPTIDLSNTAANKRLGVRFTQAGVMGNNAGNSLPLTSIMVSIDGGVSFIDTLFLNLAEPFQKPFCKTETVPLPLDVVGSDQFVFKFVFSGNSFFWIIDDVMVVELYENDLSISKDFFAVPPNYSIAPQMIEPIEFLAEVRNVGSLTQESVHLYVDIVNDHNLETVFSDTLFLGTIEPEVISDAVSFPKKFTPKVGFKYTGYYSVASENEDEFPDNNTIAFQFETTGNTLSKSKSRFSINSGFTPESQNIRFEIGNCFFVPPGAQMDAVSVTFALANARFVADQPTNVRVNLYQWENTEGIGDQNGDMFANDHEYIEVAQETYTLADNTLLLWDTIQVNFSTPIPLEDSTYYFATIEYYDPAIYNGQFVRFFISGSEEINYNAMFYQSAFSELPKYVTMLRLSGSTDFQVNAWGLMRVPFVQLNVDLPTSIEAPASPTVLFSVFPNPGRDQISLSLADDHFGHKIAFEIYDICGRVVMPRQEVANYVGQLPIDIATFRNGLYSLRVIAGDKTGSLLFVKSE